MNTLLGAIQPAAWKKQNLPDGKSVGMVEIFIRVGIMLVFLHDSVGYHEACGDSQRGKFNIMSGPSLSTSL